MALLTLMSENVPVPVAWMPAPEDGCAVNASLVAVPGELVSLKLAEVVPPALAAHQRG